ncbi:MAG: Smr/MutS family protein [Solobacterium sp.]|nr:Smr/MutS family protein [Solobacterium sp.]
MSLAKSLELDVILHEIQRSCAFSLGQKRIEETVPSYDKLIIRRENTLIREALAAVIHSGPMPFAGIRDIRGSLQDAVRGRTLSGQELNQVRDQILGVRGILSYDSALDIEHPAIHDLVSTLTLHEHAEEEISRCINPYGEVMDSASPELSRIRRDLSRAEMAITEAVNRFISTHPSSVVDNIVTYRGGRAVILVKAGEKNAFGGLVYGDSASGQASYIEPSSLFNANNRRQQLLDAQEEEIERILKELSSEVGKIGTEELANLETLAILDALSAKAQWGAEHDAVVAELTEERKLYLRQARHPLIDPEAVVANDYHLEDPVRMLLITGPNTGGKTVSMKIIGLFTLMTYCGIPVTSREAVIPYFDHVYADIGDDQSVVSSLSSFSSSIRKLSEIIENATGDSLVLADEIGSGTDPREGESLAIAILNELRERKTMVVATTHYGRLKTYGKRHPDILLASVQFDMDKLEPTYRYIEGLTGQSNALAVARKYGLPRGITNYARFLINQAKTEEDHLIEQLERQVNENEQLKRELQEREQALAEKEKQVSAKEKQVNYEKEVLRDKAAEEAEKIREEARAEAEEILANMRRMSMGTKYHEVLEEKKKLDRPTEQEVQANDDEYHVGDAVELRQGTQVGVVTEIRRKDITVMINGRAMHVKPSQIRHSTKIIPKKPEKTIVRIETGYAGNITTECNLIGMRVEEAMEELSEYLDKARLHNLKVFRIIHGDGSGALRKAVHQKLERTPGVESYRIGMPQEGGTGATVVQMKE